MSRRGEETPEAYLAPMLPSIGRMNAMMSQMQREMDAMMRGGLMGGGLLGASPFEMLRCETVPNFQL